MVVQIRSAIRRHHSQRETLRGLGLTGIRHARLMPDSPEVRGMIGKVRHLVFVYEGPGMGPLTPAMTAAFAVLRRFNRRVTRTEQSAFWRRYANTIPNVVMRMESMQLEPTGPAQFAMQGIVRSVLEDFNQDEINAFVLDYRQYTQNNDAISIGSLARIYAQPWMHSGARKNFEEARRRYNRELDAQATLIFGDTAMRIRDLVDIVVYGGLAHSNPEKAAIFEDWESSGIMGFVWADFYAAMRDLMHTLKQLRTLNEQVLAIADPTTAQGMRSLR